MLRASLFVLVALAAGLTACKDPSEGKPKAAVEEPAKEAVAEGKEEARAEGAALPEAPQGALPFTDEHGTLGFVGSKVTGSHDGGFKDFEGWVDLDKNQLKAVAVKIDMDSVWSDTEKLTGHLKKGDFFLVSKHPTAMFRTTAVEEGGDDGATHLITGELTMRGVTKKITFPVNIKLSDDKANVKAEFSIDRKDFGIVYDGKPDDLIRDNVVLKIDLSVPREAGA